MTAETSAEAPGRVALVTGATRSRGIAAAVARALARDGWHVATTGWRAYDASEPWGSAPEEAARLVDELRGLGVRAGFHEDDLGEAAAAPRVLAAAEAAVGPVSALVCVHTHSGLGGLLETTAEDFDRHLAVNARGTMLLMAEFVRRFRGEPGTGRIVSVTSAPPLAGEVAYAASKGALEWLTLAVASELAGRGITMNAVDPGPTDTGWLDDRLHATIRAASPLGRLGRPEDAATLIAFLCSPSGGWVNGQVLHSDGGFGSLRTLRHGRRTAPASG